MSGKPGESGAEKAHDGTGKTDVGKARAGNHNAAHEGAGRDADAPRLANQCGGKA